MEDEEYEGLGGKRISTRGNYRWATSNHNILVIFKIDLIMKVKNGATLLLMGSRDEDHLKAQDPAQKTKVGQPAKFFILVAT